MTEAITVLTVRGEAHVVIDPDEAEIRCVVRSVPTDRYRAVADARAKLAKATALLSKWGAVERGPQTLRADLTSLVCGTIVREQRDDRTGQQTRRFRATVPLSIFARTFGGMDTLIGGLSALDGVDIVGVRWTVDPDHPGWTRARSDATRAAIRAAHDYASVLGGAIHSVEQIADGAGSAPADAEPHRVTPLGRSPEAEDISVDPEPQRLTAVVEARFTATVDPVALSPSGP